MVSMVAFSAARSGRSGQLLRVCCRFREFQRLDWIGFPPARERCGATPIKPSQRECDEDPQNHGEQMKKKILERVHWPMRRMNVHDGSCNVGVGGHRCADRL